ncbi:hypothetical protein B0A50_03598 [Salinomyces thailandicus]|uniref:Splicing factor YJU2 n=1 Tax=Salinomyces thailandicus TaxID=706561 RepID=A0A4U0U5Z2_9PEZI|nr:hypothetical protein B0A50_03598 [Salinomyces thailandica]
MSERKVLQKYYPPDFDPSALEKRRKGPKATGPKVQPVRLMAPFSMKCVSCGEYIYKGRKFNARKETTEEKYYNITIFRFYIRCTRCSAEITFKTDPKHMDYECERGARRNFEVWREAKLAEETEEEMLDRLEKEEAERDVMGELEKKTNEAQTEMRVADALDEVRMRNAMRERGGVDGALSGVAGAARGEQDENAERVEKEIAEEARLAFLSATGERIRRLDEAVELEEPWASSSSSSTLSSLDGMKKSDASEQADKAAMPPPPPPPAATLQKKARAKKDLAAGLGIKKATPALVEPAAPTQPTPAPVSAAPVAVAGLGSGLVGYDSDDD